MLPRLGLNKQSVASTPKRIDEDQDCPLWVKRRSKNPSLRCLLCPRTRQCVFAHVRFVPIADISPMAVARFLRRNMRAGSGLYGWGYGRQTGSSLFDYHWRYTLSYTAALGQFVILCRRGYQWTRDNLLGDQTPFKGPNFSCSYRSRQSAPTILQKSVLANPGTTAGTLALISGRLFYWRDSPVRPRVRNIQLLACQLVDDLSSMRAGFCIQLAR